MDHSVKGYLERRTDAELVMALEFCISQNDPEFYRETIELIRIIQEKRKATSQS